MFHLHLKLNHIHYRLCLCLKKNKDEGTYCHQKLVPKLNYQDLMLRFLKELIYVAVSITNNCEYCIKSHSLAAKKKGATNSMLNEMIAVVGMANETNRLVEGYQVEVDDFIK